MTIADDFVKDFITGPNSDPVPWAFATALYGIVGSLVPKDSIHGEKHSRNVMALARAIITHMNKNNIPHNLDPYIIAISARLHDMGRMDDGDDPEHGERGVKMLNTFLKIHQDKFAHDYDTEMRVLLEAMDERNVSIFLQRKKGKILQCIKIHCDDSNGGDLYEKIIKDANKLDRYRININGPDPDRMGLPDISNSDELRLVAKMLNGITM